MKWAEISIQTSHEATEVVANIFHELGSSGVVIEDPALVNSYRRSGAWDYCGIPEEADETVVIVKGYLPVDEQLEQKLCRLEECIRQLEGHQLERGHGSIQCREIHEQDWASAWKAFFHTMKVGERIVIKPSWEDYQAADGELVIELDPGMAFGTGTHHTTAMCIRCLEEYIRAGQQVFDIGTGSGVLAVAAAKLGAAVVQAVDLDSVAVRVAAENIAINHVGHMVKVAAGDLLSGVTGTADVIIANIIADVIIVLLADVEQRLNDGGVLIASGIIADRLSDVTAAILTRGFIIDKVIEEGGWVAVVVRKGG